MNGARAPGSVGRMRCIARGRPAVRAASRKQRIARVPPFNGSLVDAEPRFKISFRLALFRADISFHSSNVYGVVTNQLPLRRARLSARIRSSSIRLKFVSCIIHGSTGTYCPMHFIHVYSAYLSSSLYPFRRLAAPLGTKARPLFRDTNYYAFTETDTRRGVCARAGPRSRRRTDL